jgi:hypothetical protein
MPRPRARLKSYRWIEAQATRSWRDAFADPDVARAYAAICPQVSRRPHQGKDITRLGGLQIY